MKLADQLIKLALPQSYRLIAISDVHGNAPALKSLLKKIAYSPKDVLVFLGDLFERCPYYEETIDFILDIRHNPNVYFIRGNWERFVFSLDYERFIHFYDKDRTLLMYWAQEENRLPLTPENFEEVKSYFYQKNKAFLDWTFSQDLGIETQDMVFVHAGLSNDPNWRNSDENDVVRNWDYINKQQFTGKWVVSGHVPSSNYVQSGMTSLPIINQDNHIILIDGGSGITKFGQVNALIVKKEKGMLNFDYDFADNFPRRIVQKDFQPTHNLQMKTDWRDIYFDILQQGKSFAYVLLTQSKKYMYVKNEYITEKNGHLCAQNYICNLPKVLCRETVSIIDDTTKEYYLIKKQDGEIGWVPSSIF